MYKAEDSRYDHMIYRRCGNKGLKLPVVSLGLWHNFGDMTLVDTSRKMIHRSFDLGITHFDLANNYGPPAGSAESNFGRIIREDMKAYRDEMIISSKAGYDMWQGPYGEWGSRKHLISSIDQSLKRVGVEYFDIFYHHRPDPETDLEETMVALDQIVKSGKALYVGLSNYHKIDFEKAVKILKELKTPMVITQPNYSMKDRWIEEDGLLDITKSYGIGTIVFSPLAQGLLTNRYLKEIPADSRAASGSAFLKSNQITPELRRTLNALNDIALERGQSLAQMALAWVLKDPRITSVLIGASRLSQIEDNVTIIKKLDFEIEEINRIDTIIQEL